MMRRHLKLIVVATSCAAIGAGASVIASAGAASSTTTTKPSQARMRQRLRARRLLARSVHGDLVVATKTGFATVTFDRGRVQSVNGQQLTLTEGTKTSTYKTVTLTIPAGARVRDDGQRTTLADVKSGQRVIVVQGPKQTFVRAHNVR